MVKATRNKFFKCYAEGVHDIEKHYHPSKCGILKVEGIRWCVMKQPSLASLID